LARHSTTTAKWIRAIPARHSRRAKSCTPIGRTTRRAPSIRTEPCSRCRMRKTIGIARVRVNNSGPYIEGRMLDVSRVTAEQLGFIDAGANQLKVIVISGPVQGDE
jgi:Lytic transglycolase